MALENTKKDVTYVSVLSDGSMRVVVDENTEGAVRRDYETSDGKTGTKWELVYNKLSGYITGIQFYDGDFGNNLQLTITDGEEKPIVLSLSTGSNFGEDMMKKLPAIDLTKRVVMIPYSFEDDNGKLRKGMTVIQNGDEKIANFFYDPTTKKNLHGYPETSFGKKKTISKDEWKAYFLQCRIFLTDYINEHLATKPQEGKSDKELDDTLEEMTEGETLPDKPF